MGGHVGHRCRVSCGPGPGGGRRVADLPRHSVRPGGEGAEAADPELTAGEGAQAVHRITRACVARGVRLEERAGSLRTVGGHTASTRVVWAVGGSWTN